MYTPQLKKKLPKAAGYCAKYQLHSHTHMKNLQLITFRCFFCCRFLLVYLPYYIHIIFSFSFFIIIRWSY